MRKGGRGDTTYIQWYQQPSNLTYVREKSGCLARTKQEGVRLTLIKYGVEWCDIIRTCNSICITN